MEKDYFGFENRAKETLTADGLQEMYIDRRCKDYDAIDPEKIVNSKDIHGGLVDTYGQFDLTELTYDNENYEAEELEKEYGVKVDEYNRNINFVWVLEIMAEQSLDWLMSQIDGFEARVISVYSPSYYNYTTDDYEFEIIKNPFETKEALIENIQKAVCDINTLTDELSRRLCDSYVYDMIETIDNAVIENTESLSINGKDYNSVDDWLAEVKK